MNSQPKNSDNEYIYVPDDIVRDLDRALDNIEKARRGLIKTRDEKTRKEKPEPDDNEQKENNHLDK